MNNYKKVIDRMMWVQVAPAPNAHAAAVSFCSDLRNDASRNPFVYQLVSATVLNRFNIVTKAWDLLISPALSPALAAGGGCLFAPSFALQGTFAAGSTTTSVVISTAFPAAVGVNVLANRGGSGEYGYKIRVIGNAAAGNGRLEERWIIGNTEGTQPTIALDVALSNAPVAGDRYEILSGKVYMLSGGVMAAASYRSLEIATNALTSLSNTNLPATVSTDFAGHVLDEQYVPYDHKPGEGFVVGASTYDAGSTCGARRCLLATGVAASALTGQASGGDATVLLNEYRNFQIRIVEDTATPTAVGQRRVIASHTAGVSPIYTLGAAWTVPPSATAKFVIEYPNLIVCWHTANAVTYTYNYSDQATNNGTTNLAANAWSATYFGNRGGNMGAGCMVFPSFGIQPNDAKNSRHSFIFTFRGAAATTLDLLDIAGGASGLWSNNIAYDKGAKTQTTGSCGEYAPFDNEGRFGYINSYTASLYNQMFRFDVKARTLNPFTPTDWIQAGTAAAGDRVTTYVAIDGTDKYTVVFMQSHLSTITQEIVVQV